VGEGEPSLPRQCWAAAAATGEVSMGLTRRKAEAAGMTEVAPTHSEALVQEEGSMAARSRGSRWLGAQSGIQAAVVGVGASSAVVGRTEGRCRGCDELMMN
jgi:hypothetical protein